MGINLDSGDHVAALLHDYIGFTVLSTTPTGKPVVGAEELEGHLEKV